LTLACVFGCSGSILTADEAAFFRDVRPWGFILFGRNVERPEQVRALVAALRETIDRPDAPVMIDQEGGRVQRLGPPHWRRYPPARRYGASSHGRELARLGARLIANDLHALGINVDCAPVMDVPVAGAHDIIGDRAYGARPEEAAVLGRAAAEGLIAGGVLPVIKHIPGHGRAGVDSHEALPVVVADRETLEAWDLAPFRAVSDMPMAMTAHVVYAAVDATRPCTTSRAVISQLVRGAIGFDGLLISDDLSMKALSGDLTQRARAAHSAGCDVVLHCNGDLGEMRAVAKGSRALAGQAGRRARAALARLPAEPEPLDVSAAIARLEAALAGARAA
jgi:beta-N-acetylhexosaminidase